MTLQPEIYGVTATFGADISVRRPGADRHIAHALLMFGPAMVMIDSEWGDKVAWFKDPDGKVLSVSQHV